MAGIWDKLKEKLPKVKFAEKPPATSAAKAPAASPIKSSTASPTKPPAASAAKPPAASATTAPAAKEGKPVVAVINEEFRMKEEEEQPKSSAEDHRSARPAEAAHSVAVLPAENQPRSPAAEAKPSLGEVWSEDHRAEAGQPQLGEGSAEPSVEGPLRSTAPIQNPEAKFFDAINQFSLDDLRRRKRDLESMLSLLETELADGIVSKEAYEDIKRNATEKLKEVDFELRAIQRLISRLKTRKTGRTPAARSGTGRRRRGKKNPRRKGR